MIHTFSFQNHINTLGKNEHILNTGRLLSSGLFFLLYSTLSLELGQFTRLTIISKIHAYSKTNMSWPWSYFCVDIYASPPHLMSIWSHNRCINSRQSSSHWRLRDRQINEATSSRSQNLPWEIGSQIKCFRLVKVSLALFHF